MDKDVQGDLEYKGGESLLFSGLPADEQERIVNAASRVSCKAHAMILFPDEQSGSLSIVRSGCAKIMQVSPEGRELILDICGRGELLGICVLMSSAPVGSYAEAMTDASLYQLVPSEARALYDALPGFRSLVMRVLFQRSKLLEQRLCDLVFRDVPSRIAGVLLWLAEKFGEPDGGGDRRIGLKITHLDIASVAGTTRETATSVLLELREMDVIATRGRTIIIHDPVSLADLYHHGLGG